MRKSKKIISIIMVIALMLVAMLGSLSALCATATPDPAPAINRMSTNSVSDGATTPPTGSTPAPAPTFTPGNNYPFRPGNGYIFRPGDNLPFGSGNSSHSGLGNNHSSTPVIPVTPVTLDTETGLSLADSTISNGTHSYTFKNNDSSKFNVTLHPNDAGEYTGSIAGTGNDGEYAINGNIKIKISSSKDEDLIKETDASKNVIDEAKAYREALKESLKELLKGNADETAVPVLSKGTGNADETAVPVLSTGTGNADETAVPGLSMGTGTGNAADNDALKDVLVNASINALNDMVTSVDADTITDEDLDALNDTLNDALNDTINDATEAAGISVSPNEEHAGVKAADTSAINDALNKVVDTSVLIDDANNNSRQIENSIKDMINSYVNPNKGEYKVTVNADGTITITDPAKDPNAGTGNTGGTITITDPGNDLIRVLKDPLTGKLTITGNNPGKSTNATVANPTITGKDTDKLPIPVTIPGTIPGTNEVTDTITITIKNDKGNITGNLTINEVVPSNDNPPTFSPGNVNIKDPIDTTETNANEIRRKILTDDISKSLIAGTLKMHPPKGDEILTIEANYTITDDDKAG